MRKSHFSITALSWLAILLALAAGLVMVSAAGAQTPDTSSISDDQVNAIAKQMFCPVCESTPLDVCPTQACAQWRELIREKLAVGWSEQQIKDYFVEQYGARVLAAPPAKGFYWLVYIIPPIAIIGGAYVLWRAIRSYQKPTPSASPDAQPPVENEYIRQLEEELKKN
jgi:cytochrome c-type biogenesis protein CcmH